MRKLGPLLLLPFLVSFPLTATAQNDDQLAKARGVALVRELKVITPQLKSPHNRIKSQLWAGNLIWNIDEKLGREFFSDAMTWFREFLASIKPDDPYFQTHSAMFELRSEIALIVAKRDPGAALDFVRATQTTDRAASPDERSLEEKSLEISIATKMASTDPARALRLAQQNLKSSYSPDLPDTVWQLWRRSPELGSQLANEIATKLMNEKLLLNPRAASLAINLLLMTRRSEVKLEANLNKPPILPDEMARELLQKMVNEVSSYAPKDKWTANSSFLSLDSSLQSYGTDFTAIVPGVEAIAQKKMTEVGAPNIAALNYAPERTTFNVLISAGELERARQFIDEHISNPYQRQLSLDTIEKQRININTSKGNFEEALETVRAFRDSKERGEWLVLVLQQIEQQLKGAAAVKVLEQARALLPVEVHDPSEMTPLLEIARLFSRYDSKRAFEIVNPLIDRFNELSAAVRELQGFSSETFEAGEMNLYKAGSVMGQAGHLSRVIGTLALADFDGSKAAADRIQPFEVRVRAYLEIAAQTIEAK
ncbi:MAG TPA: hypothetical protein VF075_13210 [Pyrinomonadaceae bacterium]